MHKTSLRPALAALLLAAAGAACAHPGHDGGHGGFLAGLLHPLSGADHLLALLAIGLCSGLSARRWRAQAGLAALPLALFAAGVAWGLTAPLPVLLEPALAWTVLALGLLVAASPRLPRTASLPLVGLFALLHGGAHGQDWRGGAQPLALAAGAVAATAILLAAGGGLGRVLGEAGVWARHAAGAAVAAAGLLLMAGVA